MGAGGHQNGYSVGRSGQIAAPSRLTPARAVQSACVVGRWISHRPTPAASSRHPTSTPQVEPESIRCRKTGPYYWRTLFICFRDAVCLTTERPKKFSGIVSVSGHQAGLGEDALPGISAPSAPAVPAYPPRPPRARFRPVMAAGWGIYLFF